MNTYIIYTKCQDPAGKTLKLKATGYSLTQPGERSVIFEDNGKQVAIFNMNEIVGFVQADHIVN